MYIRFRGLFKREILILSDLKKKTDIILASLLMDLIKQFSIMRSLIKKSMNILIIINKYRINFGRYQIFQDNFCHLHTNFH